MKRRVAIYCLAIIIFVYNLRTATEFKTETFSLYVLLVMFIIPVFRYPKYVALIIN